MSSRKYDGVLTILESAQASIKSISKAKLEKSLPKPFSSNYNEKLAQSIYLMADRLVYHGVNDSVNTASILWNSLGTLKSCIAALQGAQSLPIPVLNSADDETFKLSVIYLSVLKSLNVELCPDAADYIKVLGASKDFLDSLTIFGPNELTTNLVTYFNGIAEQARKDELLDFVRKAKLKDLEKYLAQDGMALEVGTKLAEIKKIESISQLSKHMGIMVKWYRKLWHVKLNTNGHALLSVATDADVPLDNLPIDKPTLVKFKSSENVDVVRVYRCEWPKTFSLLLTKTPNDVSEITLNEDDDAFYEAGLIRVKNEDGLNQLFYLDRQTNSLEQLDLTSDQLKAWDNTIGFSNGRCLNVPDLKLRAISAICSEINLGKKWVHFDLDTKASYISDLKFPTSLGGVETLLYEKEANALLYRDIVISYNAQISVTKRTKTSVPLSEQIDKLKHTIDIQEKEMTLLKEDVSKISAEIENGEEEIGRLEKEIGSNIHSQGNIEHAKINNASLQTVFNVAKIFSRMPIIGQVANQVVPSLVNSLENVVAELVDSKHIDKIKTINQTQKTLSTKRREKEKQDKNLATKQKNCIQNKFRLLKLQIAQFEYEELNSLFKGFDVYMEQMEIRLQILKKRKMMVRLESNEQLDARHDKREALGRQLLALDGKLIQMGEELASLPKDSREEQKIYAEYLGIQKRQGELHKAFIEMVAQDQKLEDMERTAADFSNLLQHQTNRIKHELILFKTILLNSPVLPYFALLSGAIAITITMGILLSNPQFAVFVLLGMGLTQPLAIAGAVSGGVIAVAGGAKLLSNSFFKSKSEDSIQPPTAMAATASA